MSTYTLIAPSRVVLEKGAIDKDGAWLPVGEQASSRMVLVTALLEDEPGTCETCIGSGKIAGKQPDPSDAAKLLPIDCTACKGSTKQRVQGPECAFVVLGDTDKEVEDAIFAKVDLERTARAQQKQPAASPIGPALGVPVTR